MAFIKNKLAGDPTNWWALNHSAVEAMMRSAGLSIASNPADETYICYKECGSIGVGEDWNESEFLSATGRQWQDHFSKKVKREQIENRKF